MTEGFVLLTADQMNALSRFNRQFNVKQLELVQGDESRVTIHAILKGGKIEIRKGFTLDAKGKLVGVIKDESGAANTENPS